MKTRHHRSVIPFAAFIVILSLLAPVSAQDWKGAARVTGKVTDEEGKGVKDAVVKLRHAQLNAGPDVKTNRKGEFTAEGLKAGEWNVAVEAKQFAIRRATVTVPETGAPQPMAVSLVKERSTAQAKELNKLLTRGDELFKTGNMPGARAEYEKVLLDRPDELVIHKAIAFTYGREGNHAEALKHFDLALPAGLSEGELELAAVSAIEINDIPRAMNYLSNVKDSELTSPDGLSNIAIALINKSKTSEAVVILDRVTARFPDGPNAYYYRGFAKLKMQKNNDEGKADLAKFVSLAPADNQFVEQAKQILSEIK
ncbi:MAG: carboxypeptidase regulatory-like domain-containing protein [Acidobacteria bacterium]|nr:carboxypeptidase regulatory-like domain-containing protein [Acidobacteriota bacterium]